MLKKKLFYLLLIITALLGLCLRILDYDKLPSFSETRDEFMYPWAGMSLIKTGIPTSWADFYSYKEKTPVVFWGVNFNLVSPWNEKPPFYPLLVGGWSIINGAKELSDVRLSVIRQVPIFLNIFSIIFIGLLTATVFNKKTGIIAALLYATIPTIVIANRLSLLENLLIPLSLFTFWSLFKFKNKAFMPYLVGLGCGLTLLTKNTGLALPIAIVFILFKQKKWKNLLIISMITLFSSLIHLLMSIYYGWDLYTGLMEEYRKYMNIGLPETIVSIFRYPIIGHKEAIFLDGGMLLGWILLLSSPFWLLNRHPERSEGSSFLSYPLFFVLQMCFVVGGQTWFGWHWFPVYPFLTIIIALAFMDLYEKFDLFKFILFYIVLSASSLRFIMLITNNLTLDWGKILGGVFIFLFLIFQIKNSKIQKTLLLCLFTLYIAVNIYTIINLKLIYPSMAQPLN